VCSSDLGGKLIIIAEVYKGGKYDQVLQKLAGWWHLALHSGTEYRDLFTRAGYAAIQIFEHYDNGWICVIGEKPAAGPPGEESPGRDDEVGMEEVRPQPGCSTP